MKNKPLLIFKRMMPNLLLLFSILCTSIGYTQNPLQVYAIKGTSDFIKCDNLGNLYLVKADQITKYDPSGKVVNRYSNKILGRIQYLDVSNPMKLLVFYPGFNKVVFLDSQLSENGQSVNLAEVDLDQSILACTSHDNGMWAYDQRNFELVRVDQNMQITHHSGNIPVQTGIDFKPVSIFEYNNWVYACDSAAGILVFDVFGVFNKTIPVYGISDLQFDAEYLRYFQKGVLESMNLKTLTPEKFILPRAGAMYAIKQGQRVFLRDSDQVICYQYP